MAGASLMKLSDIQTLKIPYRGNLLNLEIGKTMLPNTRLVQKGDTLQILLTSLCVSDKEKADEVQSRLISWLKAEARRYLTLEVEKQKRRYGIAYKDIVIKDTASRWGSCSALKNLNFSWRLILAPPEILEYVVTHEIAHLTHLNHSSEFWNLVASRYPEYKKAKQWLTDNGQAIMNFLN